MAGWKEERDIEVSTDLIGLIRKINTDSSAQRPDNSEGTEPDGWKYKGKSEWDGETADTERRMRVCPTPQTEKTVSVDLATLGQQRRTQPQLPSHNAGRLCLQQKHCDNKKGCSSLCLKHRGADSSDRRLKEHQGFVYNHPKNIMYVVIKRYQRKITEEYTFIQTQL